MAEETTEDIIKQGYKPPVGYSPGVGGLQSFDIYQYDKDGYAIDKRSGTANAFANRSYRDDVDPEKNRIGDYYYKNGKLEVVPSSPTDIYNRTKFTNDTGLVAKPKKSDFIDVFNSLVTPSIGNAAGTGVAAVGGAVKAAKAGAAAGVGAISAAGPWALIGGAMVALNSRQNVAKQEAAYKKALEDWNEQQRNAKWEVAGRVEKNDKGELIFIPDYSKATKANTAFLGTDIQKAFERDVSVKFGDDGRLKVTVNPVFAATDEYKDLLNLIGEGYAGLTADSANFNEAISDIEQYIRTASDQFNFRRQAHSLYTAQVPGASEEAIDDCYTNEIGSYVSEEEGKSTPVKVYRDGKIVETTAYDVLNKVYEMDKGKRSDYMISLWQKLEDPKISDDDKAYIYSEIRMLEQASENSKTYDNGKKNEKGEEIKTTNKYKGMLDQDWIAAVANARFLPVSLGELSNALNNITPWNMNYNSQAGLKRDEALNSALAAIGAATSAAASYGMMQGIEHGIVRPLAGKIGSALNGAFGKIAANGGKLSDIIGYVQLTAGALAEKLGGVKVLTNPIVQTLGWSIGELTYNAVSDVIFDVAKLGIRRLGGEEDAFDSLGDELSADLLMDVLIQYGPMGMAGFKSELQNNRLEAAYAPYKVDFEKSRADFDAAELEFNALKEELKSMRKGTKKYEAKAAEVKKAEKNFKKTEKVYTEQKTKVDEALQKALPGLSEELGAMIAGKLANLESKNVTMWLRKKLTDENAALSTVAEEAYNKTQDVFYYQAAVNKMGSLQSNINEVLTTMKMDGYAKGTGEAYTKWTQAIYEVSHKGKLNKAQINYIVAKERLEIFTRLNKGNQAEINKAKEKYEPYIEAMAGEEKAKLDQLIVATKNFLAKVGESYVNSGAASKESMKDIEQAALGDGYIPLWGKDKYKLMSQGYEVPKTLRVGRTFDESEGMFDVDGTNSPILSAAAYVRNIANNIARNNMASQLYSMVQDDAVSDLKLVKNGVAGANKEVQDMIDEALDNIAKSEEKAINNAVSFDDFKKQMDPFSDANAGTNVGKKMDGLAKSQKKLQEMVAQANKEVDPVKKEKLISDIEAHQKKMERQRVAIRKDVDNRMRAAGEYFNKTYKKFGLTVDIDGTLSSKEYTRWIDGRLKAGTERSMKMLKNELSQRVNQIAPYVPIKKINKSIVDKEVNSFRAHARNRYKKLHPDWTDKQVEAAVNRATKDFRNQYSGTAGPDASVDETPTGGGYKINFSLNGKDASFYVTGKLAKEVAAEMNSTASVDRNMMSSIMKEAANIKRLLTTGIDPTRVIPNLLRDTGRAFIMEGNKSFWVSDNSPFGFRKMFEMEAKAQGYSDEQIQKVFKKLEAAQEVASGSTYNEVFSGRRRLSGKRLVEDYVQGENRGTRFVWNLQHGKRKALETPMNMAESFTRNRVAEGAFWEAFFRGKNVYDLETRIEHAYEAGLNSGREATMNFSRRGTTIAKISSYVPYLSQKFSSIESAKISFLKDPIGVSTRLMLFGAAYMMELSRVLSDEKSRKHYYNLSEYDRENNIILSLPGGSLITIPLDEGISKIIFPWRRGLETLYNVDPESFMMIMVNGTLNLSPFDLSGFTEGGSFNLGRGIEKLGAEITPSVFQAAYTQATGRNMYFGSSVEVTKDQLREYGTYNPTFAQYTTQSANSKHLGALANILGVPQWRLQQMVSDFTGNVGQYLVNMFDRIANASEDEQGGKDFVEATFKSFTGMDSEQVKYAFNDGIKKLEEKKNEVKEKLIAINEKIELASGEKLAEVQDEYDKVKSDFAMEVYGFVSKYISAYEITGGLDKTQANKIWYLVNFSDDDSITKGKTVESYYRDLAKKQANNEATKYSARTLDKFYDQTKNVYRDSSGTWHYSSPYGEQAFFNTIYGQGMKHQVGLRNILEGDVESLKDARSKAYDARSAAAKTGDWDTYEKVGADFDQQLIDAIAPYVKQYGADAVIGNSTVLDYLEEWIFVPNSFMKTKKGKNVSLGNNASKNRAYARPYLKKLFGLNTGYSDSSYVSRPDNYVYEEGE